MQIDEGTNGRGLSNWRQTNNPHSLTNALPTSDVDWMIACRSQEVASDREFWIKRKRRGGDGLSLVHFIGEAQCSRQMKLSDCIVPVCFSASTKPDDCTGVIVQHQCGYACSV